MPTVRGLTGTTTACAPLLGAPVLDGQNENEGYSRIVVRGMGEGNVLIRVTLSPDAEFTADKIAGTDYFIAEDICITNNGKPIENTVNAGTVEANVKLHTYKDEEKKFGLVLANYDEYGKLINADISYNLSSSLPIETSGSIVKAFLWDMAALRPVN